MTKIIITKEMDKTGEEYIMVNHNNRMHPISSPKDIDAARAIIDYEDLYYFLEDIIEVDKINEATK